ncbi:putative protein OS=Tsukamurella paurometabola (strain ATCC 8368 / DSM / CCUG 35730 /CIP 100753 / JCM 10117 / KCTC 9821 / NBRC 16120 / NCIMB 702349/ NCTC 13040) OX=521096 GN=Tpau_1997 PE=4 SV=1 [Tsukamurella paurometabola]|uniref:Uncharacterized protein n=3 Tax=Tsukamurella paurometabola TaxID=2061 RepID=D5UNP1_TSUPD|nr:hypothetical protein Tpau_1997 [Tsukamurella paurometabola DSM 20162]SUP32407.1 Uncharacterised protein [Tsukamurella paurometabola]
MNSSIRKIAATSFAIIMSTGATAFAARTATAATNPIFAEGANATTTGKAGDTVDAKVVYRLQNPGSHEMTFGRAPFDLIFTAPPPATFASDTVKVDGLSSTRSLSCTLVGAATQLHCSLPGPATVKGDITFTPKVTLPQWSPAGSRFNGGSVLYYNGNPAPVTASVNYLVGT